MVTTRSLLCHRCLVVELDVVDNLFKLHTSKDIKIFGGHVFETLVISIPRQLIASIFVVAMFVVGLVVRLGQLLPNVLVGKSSLVKLCSCQRSTKSNYILAVSLVVEDV